MPLGSREPHGGDGSLYRAHVKRAGLALLALAVGVAAAVLTMWGLSTPPRPTLEQATAVVFTRPLGHSVRLTLAGLEGRGPRERYDRCVSGAR
jgi:hypothetical protein